MAPSRTTPSDQDLLLQIVERLDKLILTTALQGRSKEDQVKYLVGLGYSNSEIGNMLATPKGTIDSIRANMGKGFKRQ